VIVSNRRKVRLLLESWKDSLKVYFFSSGNYILEDCVQINGSCDQFQSGVYFQKRSVIIVYLA